MNCGVAITGLRRVEDHSSTKAGDAALPNPTVLQPSSAFAHSGNVVLSVARNGNEEIVGREFTGLNFYLMDEEERRNGRDDSVGFLLDDGQTGVSRGCVILFRGFLC